MVIVEGTPNRAIKPCTKACATASAVIVVIGMASGHRVNLSILPESFGRWQGPDEVNVDTIKSSTRCGEC